MDTFALSSALVVAGVLVCGTARSQTTLYTFYGDSTADRFGSSVRGAGDVNADSFADLIVGAWSDDDNGTDSGSVRVFSGLDGCLLYHFDGDATGDGFGASVSGAGDVNGDGFDDLVVGAPQWYAPQPEPGYARVLSGSDGAVLFTFRGDSANDKFGVSVDGAGDVNGDGFDDLIVGAMQYVTSPFKPGYARVFSGADGSILYTFDGDSPQDFFGRSVAGAGDVDVDGFDDLIVGAHGDDNNGSDSGMARVLSGLDGSVLYTFDGNSAEDQLGVSVSGAGDVDGDGHADMIAGAYSASTSAFSSGSARVYSGADGTVLYTFDGDSAHDHFGFSVSGAGDVNGDDYADLIVGAIFDDNNGIDAGSARVFSGADGAVIATFNGEWYDDWFGYSVSGAGDVDRDGRADLIVGAFGHDHNGPSSGSARVIRASEIIGASYCSPANPNSTGQPAFVVATGSEVVTDNDATLTASQIPVNQIGYFLASQTEGLFDPPGSQGVICLTGNVGRYNRTLSIIQGPVGRVRLDLSSVPVSPPQAVLPGDTWSFQCWYKDDNFGPTSNFTDAVRITFR